MGEAQPREIWRAEIILWMSHVSANLDDEGNHTRKKMKVGPQASKPRKLNSYNNLNECVARFFQRVWELSLSLTGALTVD